MIEALNKSEEKQEHELSAEMVEDSVIGTDIEKNISDWLERKWLEFEEGTLND